MVNRCPLCRAEIRYEGSRHARDIDGELHACDLPSLPRSLLCYCGAPVIEDADGSRFDILGDYRPHEHAGAPLTEVRIEKTPRPAQTDRPPTIREWSRELPQKPPPAFTGGYSTDIDIVEE